VCALTAALALACVGEEGPARIDGDHVLYAGEPYGDLVILGDAVRGCMQSAKRTLPRVVLVETLFDCYTVDGWQKVFGCTGEDEIIMVASVLVRSQGSLWSHELTHYFGVSAEDHPCGSLALEDFSLARPDAGR
jgi:hypothetical protein